MASFLEKILGKDVAGRVQGIQYLGNIKGRESITKLITHLHDENADIRRAAAIALEQHSLSGDMDAIAALAQALNDADPGVRKNVVLGLGEFVAKAAAPEGTGGAKQAVIELLQRESDESVIKNAIIGLAQVQDPALNGPMVEALRGKDKKIAAMAIDAINDLPPTDARLDMKKALRSLL